MKLRSQLLHLESGITYCAGLLRHLKRSGLYLAFVLYNYVCISKISRLLDCEHEDAKTVYPVTRHIVTGDLQSSAALLLVRPSDLTLCYSM